jgi:predicted RNA-binding protein associated with RNAse of E/G family
MDYTSYTIEELVDLKLVKETALELAKADLDEVADALREKQVSLELANKLNSMTAEEIELLRNYNPSAMTVGSILSQEKIGKV